MIDQQGGSIASFTVKIFHFLVSDSVIGMNIFHKFSEHKMSNSFSQSIFIIIGNCDKIHKKIIHNRFLQNQYQHITLCRTEKTCPIGQVFKSSQEKTMIILRCHRFS